MQLYILDPMFRLAKPIDVDIEKKESLIWTERYADVGDFELTLRSTLSNRIDFTSGTKLAIDNSHRIMEVKTVEKRNVEDGSFLVVKGYSIESILQDRMARALWNDLTANPTWILTGTPHAIAEEMFTQVCLNGMLDAKDMLPSTSLENIFPVDTVPKSSDSITIPIEPQTLYSAIKKVCDAYDLGFRLVRNKEGGSQLYFNVYSGGDRTTQQRDLSPVLFSPELENLSDTREFKSSAEYKNVAYVFGPLGSKMVYAPTVDPIDIAGFDRRVLWVDANDVSDETLTASEVDILLTRKGEQALADHRTFSALDGELSQKSSYEYERDYFLGDLVEMQDEDGAVSNMRVTEQIFVRDQEGERSYPTLSVRAFVNDGSWLDWDIRQKKWPEFGETEYWENMP